MKISIFYLSNRKISRNVASVIKEWAKKEGIEIVEMKPEGDFAIAIGGDGTLLSAAREINKKGIPLLGINTGGLGFLTEVPRDETKEALKILLSKKYKIEKRIVLSTKLKEKCIYALNDIAITMKDLRMIYLSIYVDEEFVTSVGADGLIISTPTGSTAYSLSCGGPILTPDLSGFVITPISPHTLSFRPIVVPMDKKIEIILEKNEAIVIADGQQGFNLNVGMKISIEQADFSVNLIRTGRRTYFDILRNKLHWGG